MDLAVEKMTKQVKNLLHRFEDLLEFLSAESKQKSRRGGDYLYPQGWQEDGIETQRCLGLAAQLVHQISEP